MANRAPHLIGLIERQSVDRHVSRVCAGCFYRLATSSTLAYPAVAGLSWPRSSMPSLTLEWITVTPSWPAGRCTKDSKSKGKVFPYSLPSVGPGADPGVQAVSPQVT